MQRILNLVVPAMLIAMGCSGGSEGSGGGSGDGMGGDSSGTNGGSADGGASSGDSGGNGGNVRRSGPTCQTLSRQVEQIEANMMIVLDRSESMEWTVNGETRLEGSINAVQTVTRDLDDVIDFGLITFPSGNEDVNFISTMDGVRPDLVGPKCGVDTVDVTVGPGSATAIASALESRIPGGFTPTAKALDMARDTLLKSDGADDADHYVLLVTDGLPNCGSDYIEDVEECEQMVEDGADGADECLKRTEGEPPPDVDATVSTIESLAGDEIKTYVVGFQTRGMANLDRMAKAGNTGDQEHRSVETGVELLSVLREITGVAASCVFELDAPVADPTYIKIKVDGKQINYMSDWKLKGDRQTIQIVGDACDALQAGEGRVEVTVECDPVPII